MQTELFHLHALSALHVGVGQAAGAVDLPIARSRATHLPLVPGSGIKGVLRQAFSEGGAAEHVKTLFGPEEISASEGAASGALAVGDAHLLLMPVRALAGIMAWITCPFVLRRYREDLLRCGIKAPALPDPPEPQGAWVTSRINLTASEGNAQALKLILEDLDLNAREQHDQAWAALIAQAIHPRDTAAQSDLIARFAIVEDDTFSFLADTATEIRTRVRIDPKTRTVKEGQLWTEENLPAETVLWGVLAVGAARGKGSGLADANAMHRQWIAGLQNLSNEGQAPLLQMGGKATVGRGLVRWLA